MVNSKKFKILQVAQNLSFCAGRNANYFILIFYSTVEYVNINIYDFFWFFETSKYHILKSLKRGSMKLVHQTDFLRQNLASSAWWNMHEALYRLKGHVHN
jgi:hypothetical protein